MVETRQQHQPNATSSSQGPRSPTNSSYVTKSWSQAVASSKRKGNTKKQTVSFNPTIIQRPVSSTKAGQDAINGASSLDPIAVVRPFIKGMEHGSVLIDVHHVKDRSFLNKALLKFNETSDPDFYEDFLGYRKQSRSYLNHDFLETVWTHDSPGRKTVTETGITLEDGTFLRGFPSYPADASIVRVTLENLPFLAASLLKDEIKHRLSYFGEALDLGITKVDGIFNGEGFATLNLTLDSTNPDNECTATHVEGDSCDGLRHLEPLTRVIVWEPRDSEQRKVLLQWDATVKAMSIVVQIVLTIKNGFVVTIAIRPATSIKTAVVMIVWTRHPPKFKKWKDPRSLPNHAKAPKTLRRRPQSLFPLPPLLLR